MNKKRKQASEQSIFNNNPFLDGFFEWMASPEGERATEVLDTLLDLMDDVPVEIFSSASNTSRSSALTSARRRLRAICCIGLKAATIRKIIPWSHWPRSNWMSSKGSAFNGSLITRGERFRDCEPRENSSLSSIPQ
jgi:hypothetical protein